VVRFIGVGEEEAYGSSVQPTRYIDILRERLVFNKGITPVETVYSRAVQKYVESKASVTGSVDFVVEPENCGEIFKWTLGLVETTGTGPYTHTFKPSDTVKSFTMVVASEGLQRRICGCLVNRLEIESALDVVTGSIDIVASKEEKDTGNYTPTISTLSPFVFKNGTLTLAGNDKSRCLRAFRLRINNNIPTDDLYGFGSPYPQRILTRNRTVECEIELAFEDTTEYDTFLAGSEIALNLKFAYGDYEFEVDLPRIVYTSDVTPHIDRREPLRVTAPLQVLYDSTKGYEVALKLKNQVSGY